MQVLINTVDIPFQVGEDVFVHRTLSYWTNNAIRSVPYFSGWIKSIELGILPASRFLKKSGESSRVIVDQITYEIQPHDQFNPFGSVQIVDHVKAGASVFPSEQALLNATGKEPSIYLKSGVGSTAHTSL